MAVDHARRSIPVGPEGSPKPDEPSKRAVWPARICHENSIGGVGAMRREHASKVTRVNIFTHNGAPQALVG